LGRQHRRRPRGLRRARARDPRRRGHRLDRVRPRRPCRRLAAGRYPRADPRDRVHLDSAGEDVHASYLGPPLRLARDARRLDTSPAWHCWVGAAPALALINEIGVESIHEHDLALANRFRAGLGLRPGDSAIVSADIPGAAERLEAAGIRAAVRGGRLRTSWHVYNTKEDVDRAVDVLHM